MNIPACTYCQPQVASVGYTEKSLKDSRRRIQGLGKIPFAANGKAMASDENHPVLSRLL